jgi:uncharacterized OB-fold protein
MGTIGVPRPVPDPDSAPYWEAVAEHRLVVQRCSACDTLRFPLREVCRECGSNGWQIEDVSGRGRVISWVVTHQVFHPAFADRVPYTVLLVELEEQAGLLMHGNLRPEGEVTWLMPVRAVFESVDDDFTLVQWTPDAR